MEFCYYPLNGDKIAFISASTASDDENLYDKEYKEVKIVLNGINEMCCKKLKKYLLNTIISLESLIKIG